MKNARYELAGLTLPVLGIGRGQVLHVGPNAGFMCINLLLGSLPKADGTLKEITTEADQVLHELIAAFNKYQHINILRVHSSGDAIDPLQCGTLYDLHKALLAWSREQGRSFQMQIETNGKHEHPKFHGAVSMIHARAESLLFLVFVHGKPVTQMQNLCKHWVYTCQELLGEHWSHLSLPWKTSAYVTYTLDDIVSDKAALFTAANREGVRLQKVVG